MPVTEWSERSDAGGLSVQRLAARPRADWGALLATGRVGDVIQKAMTRLRIAGLQAKALSPRDAESAGAFVHAERLASALLIPIGPRAAGAALSRVVGNAAMQANPMAADRTADAHFDRSAGEEVAHTELTG